LFLEYRAETLRTDSALRTLLCLQKLCASLGS